MHACPRALYSVEILDIMSIEPIDAVATPGRADIRPSRSRRLPINVTGIIGNLFLSGFQNNQYLPLNGHVKSNQHRRTSKD